MKISNGMSKKNIAAKIVLAASIALIAAGCNKPDTTSNETNMTEEHETTATPTPSASPTPSTATSPTPTPSATTSAGETKTFTVKGSNFAFAPTQIKVKKGDKVKIVFENSGGFHDFVIDEFNVKTKQIQGGSSETVEFTADKAGTFEYYCSVGSHRAMGMKGSLVVE